MCIHVHKSGVLLQRERTLGSTRGGGEGANRDGLQNKGVNLERSRLSLGLRRDENRGSDLGEGSTVNASDSDCAGKR